MKQEARRVAGTYTLEIDSSSLYVEDLVVLSIYPTSLGSLPLHEDRYHWRQLYDVRPEPSIELYELGTEGIEPEEVEIMFGPRRGLLVLLSLYLAEESELRGTEEPWEGPNESIFPFMERTHDVLSILREKVRMNKE